ncbi:hypothetical protein [Celeribacter neptunius]|uniref:Uncharacterized protein n=1 Tax=Celeribacter neptunius TaxID=588602 RepID=A0A1I3LNC5_9RHOB|nr:hypothetical protein [Celeribacter neptunius]SFI86264.1 hypothetical protein SAMN04487991_1094 [Celeribacter neptunius]
MQISSSIQNLMSATSSKTAAADAGTQASTARFTVTPDPLSPESLSSGPLSSEPSSKDRIYADYDLNNISPREIDELADRLRENGSYEFKEMMMLETRGERFTQHLQDSLRDAGILDEITFEPTRRFDYLGSAADQIELSRRHGDPTEMAQDNLDALRDIHQRSEEIRTAERAPVGTGAALTRSLFAFQTAEI